MEDSLWPPFLDQLDKDPKGAFAAFYKRAMRVLRKVPPRTMRGLKEEDFKDIAHSVVLHCVDNDFRVLKQYQILVKRRPKSPGFDGWFYVVASNKARDILRAGKNPCVSMESDQSGKSLEEILPGKHNGRQSRVEAAQIIAIVREEIAAMDEYCRLLLEFAADEFKPREIASALKYPQISHKKVSDDLRYCRKKLKKRLADRGLDLADPLWA